jgi:predicted O-methyltransferase YrrM
MSKTHAIAQQLPLLRRLYRAFRPNEAIEQLINSPFIKFSPPGHFYSPIPSLEDIQRTEPSAYHEQHFGINLRASEQLELLKRLAVYYPEIPFPETQSSSSRYYYQNDFFSYGDAIALYALLRKVQPQRVIEVGSGFSSAVMLDTNDSFLDQSVQFTFIEPYPDRLNQLLKGQEQHQLIQKPVQDVSLDRFMALQAGDILFIDSSHVVKAGSDVVHLLFQVLPRLAPGVFIHFHDIFFPFEYPQQWLSEGRAWNEAYFLRSFLQYNEAFQILFFNSFMGQHYSHELEQTMPLFLKDSGGSLWLQKVR